MGDTKYQNTKTAAKEMLNDVISALGADMDKDVKWMDAATKAKAKEKYNALLHNVAYPPQLINDDNMKKYYDGLKVKSTEYFKSWVTIRKFKVDKAYSKLKMKVSRDDWETW